MKSSLQQDRQTHMRMNEYKDRMLWHNRQKKEATQCTAKEDYLTVVTHIGKAIHGDKISVYGGGQDKRHSDTPFFFLSLSNIILWLIKQSEGIFPSTIYTAIGGYSPGLDHSFPPKHKNHPGGEEHGPIFSFPPFLLDLPRKKVRECRELSKECTGAPVMEGILTAVW
jgi:hypothetical protein